MTILELKHLGDLRRGDRILDYFDGRPRRKPLVVKQPLGPIGIGGSSVDGVVFEKEHDDDIDMVFYPDQADGQPMTVERRWMTMTMTNDQPKEGPMAVSPEISEAARVGATARLAFARQQHPELVRAEAQARLDLAAAIMAMDDAADLPGRHNFNEQVAVEQAKDHYAAALADLVRGEAASSVASNPELHIEMPVATADVAPTDRAGR